MCLCTRRSSRYPAGVFASSCGIAAGHLAVAEVATFVPHPLAHPCPRPHALHPRYVRAAVEFQDWCRKSVSERDAEAREEAYVVSDGVRDGVRVSEWRRMGGRAHG